MNGKPIILAILLFVVSTLLLAACGGDDASRETKTPSPSVTPSLQSQPDTLLEDQPYHKVQRAARPTPLPTVPAADATSSPPLPALIQHTVQPGETLLGLAMHYDVSMATIQLANGMGSSIDLIAGQTLSIPGAPQWLGESSWWVIHTIQAGETLVGLARAYGLTVDEILQVNAIADPALIHIGQQLVMPVSQLVTLEVPRPTATPVAIAVAPAAADAQAVPAPAEPQTPPEPVPTATASVESQAPPTAAPPPGPADWSGYILARINQARAEHGLNALALVPELTHAAQAHAADCARRGWGSHVGSDGAVLKTRLERAGYLGRNQGENWVQALNAERAFDWWYGEIPPNDPHRRNILSPRYTEIGIGIAETGWGYIFVTDFGRR